MQRKEVGGPASTTQGQGHKDVISATDRPPAPCSDVRSEDHPSQRYVTATPPLQRTHASHVPRQAARTPVTEPGTRVAHQPREQKVRGTMSASRSVRDVPWGIPADGSKSIVGKSQKPPNMSHKTPPQRNQTQQHPAKKSTSPDASTAPQDPHPKPNHATIAARPAHPPPTRLTNPPIATPNRLTQKPRPIATSRDPMVVFVIITMDNEQQLGAAIEHHTSHAFRYDAKSSSPEVTDLDALRQPLCPHTKKR